MTTFNDLCTSFEHSGNESPLLRNACSRPRSAVDLRPLPEPHGEASFDSSWDALTSVDPGPPDTPVQS